VGRGKGDRKGKGPPNANSWIPLRATRIRSADYAVTRCLPVRPSVCPSVCLSHAGILSKRLYISSQFFSPSGSSIILQFFQTKGDGNNPTGTHLMGASNARGCEK